MGIQNQSRAVTGDWFPIIRNYWKFFCVDGKVFVDPFALDRQCFVGVWLQEGSSRCLFIETRRSAENDPERVSGLNSGTWKKIAYCKHG